MIEMKGISKTYRVRKREAGLGNAVKALFTRTYTEVEALKDMSFTISDGQIVGYIGPNGAGKSTTIKILSGILRPDSGECTVNGMVPWRDRTYTEVEALKDMSFTISDGQIVGYIGPNGAGKSTTIKILSGILRPDSGECTVNGMVPWRDRRKYVSRLGVVFGQRSQLWWDVPVMDSFCLLRDIYKVPEETFRDNLNRLRERLDLGDFLTAPARTLSLGQRMRCEIAAALLHSPDILFLDEPTIGLDAVSKLKVREFILAENQDRKTTVILTTHDMQDIDALCSRVLLIGKGQLLLDGSIQEIRAMAGENLSTEESVADLYRRFGI